MKERHPTGTETDELVAFLPELSADGFTPIAGWGGGTTDADGVFTNSWPVYNQLVKRFYRAAAKKCWSDQEYLPNGAARMIQDSDAIANASLSQIRSMLTFCVRGERFGDGHWALMIEQGNISRLLRRLREIRSNEIRSSKRVRNEEKLMTLKTETVRVSDTRPSSAPKKATHTDQWTERMFRALVARVSDRWRLVSFRGKKRGEWCGVVDVVAIRKDTSDPLRGPLKRGDLFDILLIQMKGGLADLPTKGDKERLRTVATHYRAKHIVLFEWDRGKRSAFSTLLDDDTWDLSSATKIFGVRRKVVKHLTTPAL